MASPEIVDMYDDDYWFGRDGRRNKEFAEHLNRWMGRQEELSKRLKEEAYREYLLREAERVEDVAEAGER